MEVLESAEIKVVYEQGVESGAEKVSAIFPEIKSKTESLFGWSFPERTVVVLINDRDRFLKLTDHPITLAYAVPGQDLIVLDFSTVSSKPFSLETTLTHEFCHLLLHRHISRIPRWLDEGLCQWASGGLDEIIFNQKQSLLNQAAVSGKFFLFESIEDDFPYSSNARILAYEQSKSFVSHLARRFGKEKLLDALDRMKQGQDAARAMSEAYGVSFQELESGWQGSIREDWTWFTYFSNHLYTFLFVAGALVTFLGFLKFLWKKRNYKDDEDDEDDLDF